MNTPGSKDELIRLSTLKLIQGIASGFASFVTAFRVQAVAMV